MLVKKHYPRSHGKTTGLGISQFFATVFSANELLPPRLRYTDERIAQLVREEFPSRKTAAEFGKIPWRTINAWRNRYNLGRFTSGKIPWPMSFRYDSQGRKVNGRTGTVLLSQKDVAILEQQHARRVRQQHGE